jgi:hypothetical protein
VYGLSDHVVQAFHYSEAPQRPMTEAERIPTAVGTAFVCRGPYARARLLGAARGLLHSRRRQWRSGPRIVARVPHASVTKPRAALGRTSNARGRRAKALRDTQAGQPPK